MADTTTEIQAYLEQLQAPSVGDEPDEQQIHQLLTRACQRLHKLCFLKLKRDYPRLMRPPYNIEVDELLGSIVGRLIKALRQVQPSTPRDFFQLANRHIRWELNELARSHHDQPSLLAQHEVPYSNDSESCLSLRAQTILQAIERLPEPQRETLELVRIQGLSQVEAAAILQVDERTIRRRLKQAICTLSELVDISAQ